jgi:iron(II)-dependent oxidoreductase
VGPEPLLQARDRTRWLLDGCGTDDLVRQHSPLQSPLVWDLAHVAVQEELWLRRAMHGLPSVLPDDLLDLYDAFRHGRADRADLPLLGPDEAWHLAERVRDLVLADTEPDPFVVSLVAQHEQQHAETMMATLGLRNGKPVLAPERALPPAGVLGGERLHVPAGTCTIGVDATDEPASLDNERGAHTVHVADFWIERHPVSAGRWLEFIADGGYARPELWTAAGWEHRRAAGIEAPLHWQRDSDAWWVRSFGVTCPVRPTDPVQHVDHHEAQAFARWAGGRLPTEVEWEKACCWDPATGRRRRWPWGDAAPDPARATLGGRSLGPAPVGSLPASASAFGVEQLIGDVWEWTTSRLDLWPGFEPMVYRDYTLPFAHDDTYRVLRGGSWATDAVAVRPSFRNWDLPVRRQIFSGVRLAFDGPA